MLRDMLGIIHEAINELPDSCTPRGKGCGIIGYGFINAPSQ